MIRNPRRPARGLTLLEVLISISLIAMLLSALLTFMWETNETRRQCAEYSGRTELARQVLERIALELRGCVGAEEIGFPMEQRLVGDRRSITLLTAVMPAAHQYEFLDGLDEPPPAQHDLTFVSYRLWIDPYEKTEEGEPLVGGLLRTEKKTLNQFLVDEEDPFDIRTDLWSHEIGYLEFRYFDGVEWDVEWSITEGNSLPQMIQVTVGFNSITEYDLEDQDLDEYPLDQYPLGDDEEHPDRYSMIVRIPAADRFFGSRIQRLGQQASEIFGVEGGPF
jgi:prepilin-type N-terminal cleavage/methylation domain-containing protein